MPNIRVHELAKQLNLSSKELLNCIDKVGIENKKAASNLNDEETAKVKNFFKSKNQTPTQKTEQNKPYKSPEVKDTKIPEKPREELEKPKPRQENQQRYQQNKPQQRPYNNQNNRPNNKPGGYNRPDGNRSSGYNQNQTQQTQNQQNRPTQTRNQQGQQNQQNRPAGDNKRPPNTQDGKKRFSQPGNDRPGYRGQSPQTNKGGNNYSQNNKTNKSPGAKGLINEQKPGVKQNSFNKNKPTQQKYGAKSSFDNKQAKPNKPNMKKMNKKEKRKQQLLAQQQLEQQALEEAKLQENDIKVIQIGKNITVKELADKLGKGTGEIIKPLMKIGIMATINQDIDFYTAKNIAETFDIIVEEADEIDILEEAFKEEEDREEDKSERPPVVVVMGHVDHGKTSLLDAIRKTHVTDNEAGGITQHIGAYTVAVDKKPITFLDTPGHEAFTAMRMRGAQVTDIAILVVAADDGVMPQTIEAINHARAANVEIIVAINKIDRPSANPDRVKQELSEHGILTEDWGGETICVPVSAMKRTGIDQLLEMILLVAELRELKANANKHARGTIIEAQLDKGRGPVATVLIQDGTLNIGDPIVAGRTYGKIRAMMDDKGNKVKKAGPSIPVEILGLSEVPMAGDMFYVAQSERQARQVAETVVAQGREDLIKTTPQKVSLDDLFNQIQAGNVKELNIVIKADVQGSVEAVKNSLERLSNSEVRIKTIHGGVGAITESDVMLASASNAIIIGFNVRPENSAKSVADEEKVDMRLYRIIYNAIEDITAAMKGMLDPIFQEKVIGHAEIRQLFKASGVGTIAGSYITDGKFTRNATVRLVRDGIVIFDGELGALKRFKDDVKEVNSGYECGILLHNFNDIKEGDKIEAYIMEEIKR